MKAARRQAGQPASRPAGQQPEEHRYVTVSRPAALVILAAGGGTRMKSSLPKVLHPVCGRPMLDHVIAAGREVGPAEIVVVVGHRRDQLLRHLAQHAPDVRAVIQHRLGGTGHAVRAVIEAGGLDHGTVLVTYGDTPVLRARTLSALVEAHAVHHAAATALTTVMADPAGYGRIIRDADGALAEIVEEADATPEQRLITEVNSGIYAFDAALLADAVKRVATANAKGEEYLTDVVGILRADGHHVASVVLPDSDEVRGVNDRAQLAEARRILNARLVEHWMRAGVTFMDPRTVCLDVGVILAPDTEIGPCTQLEGTTVVEQGARIGAGCRLLDTKVGRGATVTHAYCESAEIGAGAVVGPFTYVPPGATIATPEAATGAGTRPGGRKRSGAPTVPGGASTKGAQEA
jgi:bifunctional UDP-N-acetylglucosamine pyrophosphorylase / glucosamine-1-phosphate N-acetyltransferase